MQCCSIDAVVVSGGSLVVWGEGGWQCDGEVYGRRCMWVVKRWRWCVGWWEGSQAVCGGHEMGMAWREVRKARDGGADVRGGAGSKAEWKFS